MKTTNMSRASLMTGQRKTTDSSKQHKARHGLLLFLVQAPDEGQPDFGYGIQIYEWVPDSYSRYIRQCLTHLQPHSYVYVCTATHSIGACIFYRHICGRMHASKNYPRDGRTFLTDAPLLLKCAMHSRHISTCMCARPCVPQQHALWGYRCWPTWASNPVTPVTDICNRGMLIGHRT
jgi:hypothetical protein